MSTPEKNRRKKRRSGTNAPRDQNQQIDRVLAALNQDFRRVVDRGGSNGARVTVFQSKRTPHGTATLPVRMSHADMKNGETVLTQLGPGQAYAAAAGLEVGWIVVVTQCSGGNAYWQRPDLNEIERLIAEGRCRHVVWMDVTRMARERRTFLDHAELLEQHGVGLHIVAMQRQLSLSEPSDRLGLAMQLEFAVIERHLTKQRTQRGIVSQLIMSGKGFFPLPPFGFEFEDEGWLRPYDPEWRWIKAIHEGLVEFRREDGVGYPKLVEYLTAAGGTITVEEITQRLGSTRRDRLGLRAYADVITWAGMPMMAARLSNILNDPIYSTGIPVNEFGGVRIAMKAIDLPDPVSHETYARNELILREAKASSVRVRLAAFAFTDVLTCDVCGSRLQAYFGGPHRTREGYRHKDPVPDCCRGAVLWRDDLEPAVIRRLLRLDADPMMRRRYFEAGRNAVNYHEIDEDLAKTKQRLEVEYDTLIAQSQSLLLKQARLAIRSAADGGANPVHQARLVEFYETPGTLETFHEVERLGLQLERFDAIADHRRRTRPRLEVFDPEMAEALRSTLTISVPTALEARLDRKHVVNACLSEIRVRPAIEHGQPVWEIKLIGPLGPIDAPPTQPIAPSSAAKAALRPLIRTVNYSYDYLTVRSMVSESGDVEVMRRLSPDQDSADVQKQVPDWISQTFVVPRS